MMLGLKEKMLWKLMLQFFILYFVVDIFIFVVGVCECFFCVNLFLLMIKLRFVVCEMLFLMYWCLYVGDIFQLLSIFLVNKFKVGFSYMEIVI